MQQKTAIPLSFYICHDAAWVFAPPILSFWLLPEKKECAALRRKKLAAFRFPGLRKSRENCTLLPSSSFPKRTRSAGLRFGGTVKEKGR